MMATLRDLKEVDSETNNLVYGYCREIYGLLPKNNTYYSIQPVLVDICTAFYWLFPIPFQLGTRVELQQGKTGMVRYIGKPEFSKKLLIGIELDIPDSFSSASNGSFGGQRLFTISSGRGYFTRVESIVNIIVNVQITLFDKVLLDIGERGKVVFIGDVHFDNLEMIGILLDKWSPNGHNGLIDGKSYFVAPQGRGLLVPLSAVRCVESYDQSYQEVKEQYDDKVIVPRIGDRICLVGGKTGVARFLGSVDFTDEQVVGVVLDKWHPNANNGMVHGKQYLEHHQEKDILQK